MKRISLLSIIGAVLLGGCGLIAAFVNPIEVEDPLQLEGATITTQRLDNTALGTLASFAGTYTTTFNDFDIDLQGFGVGGFRNNISIEPSLSVTRPDNGYPDSFSITSMALNVTLADDNDSVTIGSVFQAPITFEADCDSDAASCDYTFASGPDLEQALFVLAVQAASEAQRIYTIITTGQVEGEGPDNNVSATLSLETESTPDLVGGTITVTLTSLSGEIDLSSLD